MRTTDERMDEVLRRASARETASRRRRQRAVAIGGGGLGAAMMHVACGVVVGYGLTRAWKHAWLRAAGTFGLLCLASTYHGIFNLLVAADGAARIAAVVLPLATLIPLLIIRRRRERADSK